MPKKAKQYLKALKQAGPNKPEFLKKLFRTEVEGFALVGVMVLSALGLILAAGMMQLFSNMSSQIRSMGQKEDLRNISALLERHLQDNGACYRSLDTAGIRSFLYSGGSGSFDFGALKDSKGNTVLDLSDISALEERFGLTGNTTFRLECGTASCKDCNTASNWGTVPGITGTVCQNQWDINFISQSAVKGGVYRFNKPQKLATVQVNFTDSTDSTKWNCNGASLGAVLSSAGINCMDLRVQPVHYTSYMCGVNTCWTKHIPPLRFTTTVGGCGWKFDVYSSGTGLAMQNSMSAFGFNDALYSKPLIMALGAGTYSSSIFGFRAGAGMIAGRSKRISKATVMGAYAGRDGATYTSIGAYSSQKGGDLSSIGAYAGQENKSYTVPAALGGRYPSGGEQTFIGAYAGQKSQAGGSSMFIGAYAGQESIGYGNMFIGAYAGRKSDLSSSHQSKNVTQNIYINSKGNKGDSRVFRVGKWLHINAGGVIVNGTHKFEYQGHPPPPPTSSKVFKKNIKPFNNFQKSLQDILKTPLFTFQLKEDKPEKERMGVISEELPPHLQIKEKGKPSHPDWTSIYGTFWGAVKALYNLVMEFKEEHQASHKSLSGENKKLFMECKKEYQESRESLSQENKKLKKKVKRLKGQIKDIRKEIAVF